MNPALAIAAALIAEGYTTKKAQAAFLGVSASSWSKYTTGKGVEAATLQGWLVTAKNKGTRLALWWTADDVKAEVL